jgi:WD40 repeat protein
MQAGTIKSWDWANGGMLGRVQAHKRHVMDVHLSDDAKRMATAGYDNQVVVWERRVVVQEGKGYHHPTEDTAKRLAHQQHAKAGSSEESNGGWTWVEVGVVQFAESVHAVRMDDARLYVAAGPALHVLHVLR